MDISRTRTVFPKDAILVLTAIVIPIHIWSILHALEELPAWLLRLDLWDLFGVVSYAQVFALFESLLIFGGLVLLGVLVPRRFFGAYFAELGSLLILVLSLWAIAAQGNYGAVRNFGLPQAILWSGLVLLSLAGIFVFVYRLPKYRAAVRSFMRRLTPLAVFYLAIDVICLLVLLIRNL